MTNTYEAPTVVELGNFHEETGVGLGITQESWWPLGDRKGN